MSDSIKLSCDQASILIGLLGKERTAVVERLSDRKIKVRSSEIKVSEKFRNGLEKLIRNDEERLENIEQLLNELKEVTTCQISE